MCVNTLNLSWERPAVESDITNIEKHFPGVDYPALLKVMSQNNSRPLTSDLVLFGAMKNTEPDYLGMQYVPFSAIDKVNNTVVKLPVMNQIVDWFENTALGTDMWKDVSDWSEGQSKCRVHFAMNCNCGLVASENYQNGNWTRWKMNFNYSRSNIFGKSKVVYRDTNSIDGLDLTKKQLAVWFKIRTCLESLPYRDTDVVLNTQVFLPRQQLKPSISDHSFQV